MKMTGMTRMMITTGVGESGTGVIVRGTISGMMTSMMTGMMTVVVVAENSSS